MWTEFLLVVAVSSLFSPLMGSFLSDEPSVQDLADMSWNKTFWVNETGTRDETACLNGTECDINTVFIILAGHSELTSVLVNISTGSYQLRYGEELRINENSTAVNRRLTLGIVGVGRYVIANDTLIANAIETVITCDPMAGLYITNADLMIADVAFDSCGYDIDPHMDYHKDTAHLPLQPTALATIDCCVSLFNVNITDSNGTGLLIYHPTCNSESDIEIIYTNITGGRGMNLSQVGGGVVAIGYNNTRPNYTITQCLFTDNNYTRSANVSMGGINDIMPAEATGGAALILLEPGHSITIDTSSITDNNRAMLMYVFESFISEFIDSEVSSNWNETIISLLNEDNAQDAPILYLTLIDSNIAESVTVSQQTFGFFDTSTPQNSQCQKPLKSLKFVVSCSKECSSPSMDFQYSYVYESDIIEYPISPGVCSNNDSQYYDGYCPIPYSVTRKDDKGIIHHTCWDNHASTLCGQCIEGHSIAVNSPYLSCVECNDWKTVLKGWGMLILFQFVPLTILVVLIAVLSINLNQGSLLAFVFLCQMITIPFPAVSYPSWFVVGYNYTYRSLNLFFLPLSIWVMGFINYPLCHGDEVFPDEYLSSLVKCSSYSICISANTTPLGAITFWYLIVFYPIGLIALLYVCTLAYGKGYRCTVCFIRPIHHLLARFWNVFNIQPSFSKTVGSIYTLCFTQLVAVSFKLLHFTSPDNKSVFFYDGSQRYFHGWHGAAATLALIVLIVFVAVPIVYMTLFPFKWFQQFNRKLGRLDWISKTIKVINAPYKNGGWAADYRCFATSHYVLQIVLMALYFSSNDPGTILILQITFCGLWTVVYMVLRPYKRVIHNATQIVVLVTLMSFSLVMLVLNTFESAVQIQGTNYGTISFTLPLAFMIFYMVPLLYVSLLIAAGYALFVWIPKKYRDAFQHFNKRLPLNDHNIQHSSIAGNQSEKDSLVPNRIVNPTYDTDDAQASSM